MKDACEDCGYKPDDPGYADDDLVACHGCGKTICMNDCIWATHDEHDLYWCGGCTDPVRAMERVDNPTAVDNQGED